jgi:hypothetical protein
VGTFDKQPWGDSLSGIRASTPTGGTRIESPVEADSTGGYEARITTKAGGELRVTLDKAFAITASEAGGGHDGRSNSDPAHEAKESPAHAAEEKARDAGTAPGSGQSG